jgi:hypothetical protein
MNERNVREKKECKLRRNRKKTKSRILFTASSVKIVFKGGRTLRALHYEMGCENVFKICALRDGSLLGFSLLSLVI